VPDETEGKDDDFVLEMTRFIRSSGGSSRLQARARVCGRERSAAGCNPMEAAAAAAAEEEEELTVMKVM
jgi:hypothetical protein